MRRLPSAVSAIALTSCFISSAYAATLATPPAAPARAYETIADVVMTVRSLFAELRDVPQTSGNMLDRLPRGTKVTVTGKDPSNKWAYVTVHDMEGYIDVRQLGVSANMSQGR